MKRVQSCFFSTARSARSSATLHFYAEHSNQLSKVIADKMDIPLEEAAGLIALGSVYHAQYGNEESSKRTLNDIVTQVNDYIRVYPNTARFDTSTIDWSKVILHENEKYVVIDKPPGIACHPTVANAHENVLECVRKHIGADKLFLPHRLDSDTSGVMVLAKCPTFNAAFCNDLRHSSLIKRYRALIMSYESEDTPYVSELPLPSAGTELVHYMETSKVYPKYLYFSEVPNSKVCRSIVRLVTGPITRSICDWVHLIDELPPTDGNNRLKSGFRDWFSPPELYDSYNYDSKNVAKKEYPIMRSSTPAGVATVCEVEIELVTGRTHQLRAQLSALGGGLAIAGDKIYHTAHPGPIPPPDLRVRQRFTPSPYLALQACFMGPKTQGAALQEEYSLKHTFWESIFLL